MGRLVAVANQKGGVGKTTTVINLGASLALADRRVLLIDCDPQGNLTTGLGLKGETSRGTIYDALSAPDNRELFPIQDAVIETCITGLWLVPADRNLTGAEIELVALDAREHRLRRALAPVAQQYDFIFIDCPPALGLLTLNALVAADAVLIPLQCEYFALEGIADLLATIKRVRASLNARLEIDGLVMTMFDDRTNLANQVASEIREFFKEQVYHTAIPRNVRLGEAPSHGLPIILYDVKSRGAEAYLALAKEVLSREHQKESSRQGAERAHS